MQKDNVMNHTEADVPSTPLLCCPSCMFDDDAYEEHAKRTEYRAGPKDGYMPKLYHDRFLGKWVVKCQNCGMEVVFNSDSEEEHIKLWNYLPRKHNPTLHPPGWSAAEPRQWWKRLLAVLINEGNEE